MAWSLKSLFSRKGMQGTVTYAGQDEGGNYWYLSPWAVELANGGINHRIDFNMTTPQGKAEALAACFPLSAVLGILGDMIQNGRFYVVDNNGNEKPRFSPIARLLAKPNLLQDGKAFLKNVEINLECFGFCPVYALRATASDLPLSMTIIPPELFHIEGTGVLFAQQNLSEIIKRAYIVWAGRQILLQPEEYFLIHDSQMHIPACNGNEIRFSSPADTLSAHIRNYMAQLVARGNLIVNGGPKGILYGNDTSDVGNAALTPKEADILQEKFKRKYGIVNKLYEIMVTPKKLGWITLGSNTEQLKLFEEDKYCIQAVAQAFGIDPNLVTQGSTYDNAAAAKKAAYQDVVIPDAETICQTLTDVLCPGTARITLDFTHISYLQEDNAAMASALSTAGSAIGNLYDNGLITFEEARMELAKYIDINPDAPQGLFKAGEILETEEQEEQ